MSSIALAIKPHSGTELDDKKSHLSIRSVLLKKLVIMQFQVDFKQIYFVTCNVPVATRKKVGV